MGDEFLSYMDRLVPYLCEALDFSPGYVSLGRLNVSRLRIYQMCKISLALFLSICVDL